ncbi:uncharacterized protein LOC112087484 [Eutrema salsugineum]|uniref:uncharacterized protein LOC112087484 n=1 Tax=Eutrema salsugineum TaxID=72664 RepID=UPI000CED3CD7|nr:uncharacterized protein LOC112087484 [Eutrema salsugineum]
MKTIRRFPLAYIPSLTIVFEAQRSGVLLLSLSLSLISIFFPIIRRPRRSGNFSTFLTLLIKLLFGKSELWGRIKLTRLCRDLGLAPARLSRRRLKMEWYNCVDAVVAKGEENKTYFLYRYYIRFHII